MKKKKTKIRKGYRQCTHCGTQWTGTATICPKCECKDCDCPYKPDPGSKLCWYCDAMEEVEAADGSELNGGNNDGS
jgi:hypothetical protein